jgi:SAM-dependent methyltransferase
VGRGEPRATGEGAPYLLPRVTSEIDRLDLQHYAIREYLGTNYLAPVQSPRRVLDVGAGTGQWGWDLCAEFPNAQVIGFDLVAGKPGGPVGYHCIRGDVLKGLPFTDVSFDFVHQRFIFAGVPVKAWPAVVADLVRVARSNGWVQSAEPDLRYEPEGPAAAEVAALYRRAAQARGLDSTGLIFRSLDERLRRAGLVDVERREVELPIGEWAGRVGSLLATDFRNSAQAFLAALQQGGVITANQANDLVLRLQREFEELHTRLVVAVAFGRKP